MGEGGRLPGVGSVRTWAEATSGEARTCTCGCNDTVTHVGLADGVAVIAGCRWRVRLWVRDPTALTPHERREVDRG